MCISGSVGAQVDASSVSKEPVKEKSGFGFLKSEHLGVCVIGHRRHCCTLRVFKCAEHGVIMSVPKALHDSASECLGLNNWHLSAPLHCTGAANTPLWVRWVCFRLSGFGF